MRRIVVTKGTTIRLKKGGIFNSTDSKDAVRLKKGSILELLEVLFTPESMLAIDRNNNTKYLIPQVFITDNCEIVEMPTNKSIESVYILHDEFKDAMDWRHFAVIIMIANTVVLLTTIFTNVVSWIVKLG